MGSNPCKSKQSFYSADEAFYNGMPGLESYLCPSCGKWHQTSKSNGKRKNQERFRRKK